MSRKTLTTEASVRRPVRNAAIILLWLVVWVAHGAGLANDYLMDVWTSENGLPDSSVTAIAQTPDGYLWIGTANGLVRFDGVHFTGYDPENEPALIHAHVRQLYVDTQGTLWVNTYGGSLAAVRQGLFYGELARTNSSEADLTLVATSSNAVSFLTSRGNILQKSLNVPAGAGWQELMSPRRGLDAAGGLDSTGTLWYVGNDKRVWRVQNGQFEAVPDSAGLAGQNVNCLTIDGAGRAWVGTDNGFRVWNGSEFQDATPTNSDPIPGPVTGMVVDDAAHVWVLAGGCVGVAVNRQWLLKPDAARNLFGGNPGRVGMHADHHGGMWFENNGRGLMHMGVDGQLQRFTPEDGFPGLRVFSLFEDREGSWWAGLDSGGLVRIRERQFRTVASGDGALTAAAKSVSEDAAGNVLVGSLGGGLGRWQDGVFTAANITNAPDSILCVCPDADGRLWLSAGDDEDFYVYENGQIRRITPTLHGVKAILAGHDGRIWVGTKSGLYTGDATGIFQLFKNIPKHYVRALAEDAAGTVWVGTGNGDLYSVADGKVATFHPRDSDTSEAIWSILPDREQPGAVWVGTFRGGLLRFQDGKFSRIGKSAGLPDNVICQILEDSQTNLWFGSHQGIFRVSRAALEKVADGGTNFVPCIVYGRSDGLPSLECSGGYQPSAWRCKDGALWFATVKGAVWVQPEQMQSDLPPPPVVIEDVLVDGQSRTDFVPGGTAPPTLEIAPGRHQIEIRYTGLSLASPERVQFRYMLTDADADWVPAGMQRFAQYTFLPPGTYHFRVVACNSDGIWNETGSGLTLKVEPHFYETWWFRLLAAAGVIGAVAAVVRTIVTRRLRLRLEKLERQRAIERERARIAKDIHDDLGASLNLIAVLGDLAKKEKAVERIEKMSSTAREAVKSLDEIVWAVNPRNDTLANLIDYICQFATDYLRDAGIRCLLDVPEHTPVREVPANERHNLFLVVKEALQNIVKHAHATQVELRISANDGGLRIEVADNGCGFEKSPAPAAAWADGLENMRQRLIEIGGECRIQSSPGVGTTITVELGRTGTKPV